MNATAHRFEFDSAASTSERIVTICRHCGSVRVTEAPSQMDMWTRPVHRQQPIPADFMNRVLN